MKIFAINKRFLTSNLTSVETLLCKVASYEGWKEWIESEIISYHATEEGAKNEINSFDDKDEMIKDHRGELSSIYFISCIEVKE